eukprot:scaffold2869_cov245-Prasinococcus_capsulatus_cf.AAC.3
MSALVEALGVARISRARDGPSIIRGPPRVTAITASWSPILACGAQGRRPKPPTDTPAARRHVRAACRS